MDSHPNHEGNCINTGIILGWILIGQGVLQGTHSGKIVGVMIIGLSSMQRHNCNELHKMTIWERHLQPEDAAQ